MSGSAGISVWRASGPELAWHYVIRQQVFVVEQGALVLTDVDDHDRDPLVHHVVGAIEGEVAGAVRLYPSEGDQWRGDRLAVLAGHRATSLGARLVRFAVSTAAAAGGSVMDAHIQLPNVAFFRRLGWEEVGAPHPYLGIVHQPMRIDLRQVPHFGGGGRPSEPRLGPATETTASCLVDAVVLPAEPLASAGHQPPAA